MLLNEQCCHFNHFSDESAGLTAKELQVILSLNSEESISSSDLAKRNMLSPSRMSRIIDKLVSRGLLNRETDGEDRRYSRVSLTREGIITNKNAFEFKKSANQRSNRGSQAVNLPLFKRLFTCYYSPWRMIMETTSTIQLNTINNRYSGLAQSNCCLSCGGAVTHADVKPGEVCVDLGSGRGSDVLRMADIAGPDGFAYGSMCRTACWKKPRQRQTGSGREIPDSSNRGLKI